MQYLIDVKDAEKALGKYKFEKCDGKYVIVFEDYYEIFILKHITDYFSEECRIVCKKYNKKKSPYQVFLDIGKEYYENSKKYINNYPDYYWWSFENYLKTNKIKCQLFNTVIARSLYSYFNAKNILDFSAGWGDRLIAAISFLSSLLVNAMLGFGTFQDLRGHSASIGVSFGHGVSAILPVVACVLITVATMLVIRSDVIPAMILLAVLITVAYHDMCVAKAGVEAEQIASVFD